MSAYAFYMPFYFRLIEDACCSRFYKIDNDRDLEWKLVMDFYSTQLFTA
jgi:hypothetical protein